MGTAESNTVSSERCPTATLQPCLALLRAFGSALLNKIPGKPGINARKQQLTQTIGFAGQFRA